LAVFRAEDLRAVVLRAEVLRDGDFFVVLLDALPLFLAVLFLAVLFLAVLFLAALFLAAVFLAAVFFAVEVVDFFAGDRFPVVDLPDADVLDVLAFFLAAPELDVDFVAVPRAVEVAFAAVSLGSFLAPDTTAFRSAPARNFGTAVFFARTR
jgi:hypothetical protein